MKGLLDYNFERIPSENTMVNILIHLGERNQLKRLLHDVLADYKLTEDMSKLSESHRLGFTKLILLSTSTYQLRLHIWWPKEGIKYMEGIHNHKFNFASKIVMGEMLQEFFERSENEGIEMHEYLAIPAESRQNDLFEYKGVSKIKLIETDVQTKGTIYFLNHEKFHNAIPHNFNEMTATLFLKTKNIKPSDTIFERKPFPTDRMMAEVANNLMTVEEYRTVLKSFYDLLT